MLPAHSQVGKKKDLPARSEVEKVGTETSSSTIREERETYHPELL